MSASLTVPAGVRRVYLSGPMTSYPEFNYPAFHSAAAALREAGLEVYNPAEYAGALDTSGMSGHESPEETGFDLRVAFADSTGWICTQADAVAVLPGWAGSRGARAEVGLADAIGLVVFDALTGHIHTDETSRIATHLPRTTPERASSDAPVDAPGYGETGRIIDFERGNAHHREDTASSEATASSESSDLRDRSGLPAPVLREPAVPRERVEVRTISSTGAMKGTKEARMDLVPAGPLWELAVLYGRGQEKYPDHVAGAPNWKRGYEWSKTYQALLRHANLFWMGEDHDPEMGVKHLICVAWHALNGAWFMENRPQFDDRPTSVEPERYLGALPAPAWLVEKREAIAAETAVRLADEEVAGRKRLGQAS